MQNVRYVKENYQVSDGVIVRDEKLVSASRTRTKGTGKAEITFKRKMVQHFSAKTSSTVFADHKPRTSMLGDITERKWRRSLLNID